MEADRADLLLGCEAWRSRLVLAGSSLREIHQIGRETYDVGVRVLPIELVSQLAAPPIGWPMPKADVVRNIAIIHGHLQGQPAAKETGIADKKKPVNQQLYEFEVAMKLQQPDATPTEIAKAWNKSHPQHAKPIAEMIRKLQNARAKYRPK